MKQNTNMGNSSAKSKAKSITKLSEPKTEIFDKIDAVLFDCDGVIWHGDNLVEGVPELLELLQKLGKKYYFVTNNSTKSRTAYVEKFKGLGIGHLVTYDLIVPTSFAAVIYLQNKGYGPENPKKKVDENQKKKWRPKSNCLRTFHIKSSRSLSSSKILILN